MHIGDRFTLFGTTIDGGMAFRNFIVAGTVTFGASVLDRGAVIIDLSDARQAFVMQDAASEILGFQREGRYNNESATAIAIVFNKKYENDKDEFAPEMMRLKDQGGMADYIDLSNTMGFIMAFVFVMAMSVVLWNIGLLGGLRRYNEFGVRLAMGEGEKAYLQNADLRRHSDRADRFGHRNCCRAGYFILPAPIGINLGYMMQNSTSDDAVGRESRHYPCCLSTSASSRADLHGAGKCIVRNRYLQASNRQSFQGTRSMNQ